MATNIESGPEQTGHSAEKPVVSIRKADYYDYKTVFDAVAGVFADCGGVGKFVRPGDKVLIKPNLLGDRTPDKAVTTHPTIVRAVIEIVKSAGGIPFIGDSPAIKSLRKVARVAGIEAVADELGVPLVAFTENVSPVKTGNEMFKSLEIAREVLEADKIINLPKLKTHSQMYLTLGVKNLYGCVAGKTKILWHQKAGLDRAFFARLLMEIYSAVRPAFTVLDGIEGMEGDGPANGEKRHIGLIAGAADAVAMDAVITHMLGAKPEMNYVLSAARELGIGVPDLSRIKILGEGLESTRITDFKFPKLSEAHFGPPVMKRMMINHMTARPQEHRDKCTLCNLCVEACPTKIIENTGKQLKFNYDNCIRCYCCLEVCPEGAMHLHQPILLRLMQSAGLVG